MCSYVYELRFESVETTKVLIKTYKIADQFYTARESARENQAYEVVCSYECEGDSSVPKFDVFIFSFINTMANTSMKFSDSYDDEKSSKYC